MADYIDRQVAVEACRKNFVNKVFVADAVYNQGVENCLKRIKELPSAHPLDPCETCLHKSKGWDEEPCDGCTGTESKYEPMVSPDGTLIVNVPKGTKVKRVIVLPYADG